jgi:hypothetical protein
MTRLEALEAVAKAGRVLRNVLGAQNIPATEDPVYEPWDRLSDALDALDALPAPTQGQGEGETVEVRASVHRLPSGCLYVSGRRLSDGTLEYGGTANVIAVAVMQAPNIIPTIPTIPTIRATVATEGGGE